MLGFQAAGAAPLVHGAPVEQPQTIASAIRIGNPASWRTAIAARDESGGSIEAVTDDEILAAYSAAGARRGHLLRAGVGGGRRRAAEAGGGRRELRGQTVVCIITGNGLKDPETALKTEPPIHHVDADLATIEREMGWV